MIRGRGCDGLRSGKGALAVGGETVEVAFEDEGGVTRLGHDQRHHKVGHQGARTAFLRKIDGAMGGGAAGAEESREASEELRVRLS